MFHGRAFFRHDVYAKLFGAHSYCPLQSEQAFILLLLFLGLS